MSKAKTKTEYTTEIWTDSLGQPFSTGDFVAVATISGRSPQMVVAQVLSINTHDKDGRKYRAWKPGWPAEVHYHGTDGVDTVVVSCQPIHDGRDFGRSKGRWVHNPATGRWEHDGGTLPRKVSYRIPRNFIKLTDEQVIELLMFQDEKAEKESV